jgi:pSer/pThr/pTyr-binding forkhead associated (FHA) protein
MTRKPSIPNFASDQPNDSKSEIETHELPRDEVSIEASPRQTDPLDLDIPRRLRFVILETNDVLEVNVRLYMVIGRKTNPRDRKVDIDLTPFVTRSHGVSRYHSYIQVVDDRISITDFNSTNGTFINGESLQPSKAHRLRHGDNIRLGNFEFKILFVGID